MEIIADTTDFYIEKDTAVAIGKFDGVHLGHRRLLEEILEAKKRGLCAAVFTFDKPPAALFGGDTKVLSTNAEKHVLFERMGIDFLVEFPMNEVTAATPPRDFVTDYLVSSMNMRFLAAGSDVSFGKKGEGDAKLLENMATECEFSLKIVDKVLSSCGREISSSYVRECVEKGDMEMAESLLGMPYSVCGRIVHGNHIGHTLGFPTINIYPDENKLLPPFGVYAGHAILEGKNYRCISNVGRKPTVGGKNEVGVETYLYDFDGDAYGKDAVVFLEHFRRPEQRFESLDALKAQLMKDIDRY